MLKNAWRARGVGTALIILLTVLAYLPALSGKFVWDDDAWTTGISGLLRDFGGLRTMWCQATALQQYYPLTGTTFWLDYHLWGFWTLPYHLENIFLHATAALLFRQLLRRLQVPGAWLASAIFALHPVMVESVAWITERKNVLSLVLYLGSILAYSRFSRFWNEESELTTTASSPQPRGRMIYGLAFVLFLAAMLAKATAFSLPAVILLICWWKRGRIRWRADVLPTLPFFGVALGLCVLTAWLEKNHLGAKGPEWAISFSERCLIAGRVFWFYIGKLLWPANLCFLYPRWQLNAGSWWQWLYPVSAVGTLLTLWLARARIGRGPLVAALFLVGTLFPVLGFMNAYFMQYSFVCDHWVYLSSLGLIALAAAGITRVAERFRVPALLHGFIAVVLVMFVVLTRRQCGTYADMETLWRSTLAKNPGAWLAHNNLGTLLENQGRTPEAIEQYEQTLQFNPAYALAHYNWAIALEHTDKNNDAIEQYEQALRLKPDFPEAYFNLGGIMMRLGRIPEAVEHYSKAARIKPDSAEARYNLGNALVQAGQMPEAIAQWNQALRLKPDYFEAHNNLASALRQSGQVQAAIAQWELALQIQPDSAETHYNLAIALRPQGKISDAIRHYEQALRLKPDYLDVQNNLARLLATLGPAEGGDPVRAVPLAQRACELTSNNDVTCLDTLAIAYAATGRFDDAIATAVQAIELARSAGQEQLVQKMEARLQLYRSGHAYGRSSDKTSPRNP